MGISRAAARDRAPAHQTRRGVYHQFLESPPGSQPGNFGPRREGLLSKTSHFRGIERYGERLYAKALNYLIISISVRRLIARPPSSSSLDTIGRSEPYPLALRRLV